MSEMANRGDGSLKETIGAREEAPRPNSMIRSVVANWVWYVVVLVSGFFLPRIIDRTQGQQLLGIWDLGWSLVFYVGLLNLGIGSAVNRHVARYRTLRDWNALNAMANSCLAVLGVGTSLGVITAFGLAYLAPLMSDSADPAMLESAFWIVLLLAVGAAIKLPAGVFNGVITGFERFDVLNAIRCIRDILMLAVFCALLLGGNGIVSLAVTVLCFSCADGLAKLCVARYVCPELRVSMSWFRRDVAKEMIIFGGKTVLKNMSRAGLYQANRIIVVIFLTPAALAVYARQQALVMHLMRFVKQYAQVFAPAGSTLDAQSDTAGLQQLMIKSAKYGFYVTVLPTWLFVVMGGFLLRLWMGSDYEAPAVLAILAIGHFLSIPQQGVHSILVGMGRHGASGAIELGAAICSVLAALVVVGAFDGGLQGAAIAVAIPVAIGSGILMPAYACRVVNLRFRDYIRAVVPGPALASLPFAGSLVLARIFLADTPLSALGVGASVGGGITAVVYWRWVTPPNLKTRVVCLVKRVYPGRRVPSGAQRKGASVTRTTR